MTPRAIADKYRHCFISDRFMVRFVLAVLTNSNIAKVTLINLSRPFYNLNDFISMSHRPPIHVSTSYLIVTPPLTLNHLHPPSSISHACRRKKIQSLYLHLLIADIETVSFILFMTETFVCFKAWHQSSLSTARKAFCGTSTEPICFMRFLPFFCFSRSLRLREISPP